MRLRALLAGLLLLAPAAARAHGRPPAIQRIVADPDDPRRLFAQATWGLAVSVDGGDRWAWACASAYGVDARSEDPALVAVQDALLLGTFDGIRRSDDGGCSWVAPSAELDDIFIVDLDVDSGGRVLAIAAIAGQGDRLWESLDAGQSWTRLDGRFGEVLVDRVRVAPSDPDTIYATGAIPDPGTGVRRVFLTRSRDGGASFELFELPTAHGERSLSIWAVDPADPGVVYAQVLHFNGEAAPERIVRSADGGETWATVLEIPYVGGLFVASDGAVWAGSRLGGLFRALDGRTFDVVDPELPVTCLGEVGGGVYACVDEARAGYAMARFDGASFEPLLELASISEILSCARCTDVGVVCPSWEPDIIVDLGLDAALPPGFDPDGGTGAPRDAGVPPECRPDAGGMDAGAPTDGGPARTPPGCGCRVGARWPGPGWSGLLAFVAVRLRRRTR